MDNNGVGRTLGPLDFSPNVCSLCKGVVDIGLKRPTSRISKYATPMEVDLMRGLALQSMHRNIAVVAARFWVDSFLRRMGRNAPRPHHPPAAAPGHGGGAGGDEEKEVDDFVDDALAGNEGRFHARVSEREGERENNTLGSLMALV